MQDQPPRIRFSLPSLPNLVFHNLPNLESGFPWPPGMLFSMPSPNLVFNDLPESCFSCPPRIWFSVAPNLVCHALWRGRGPQIISHEMLAGVTSFVTRFHLPLPPCPIISVFITWCIHVFCKFKLHGAVLLCSDVCVCVCVCVCVRFFWVIALIVLLVVGNTI